MVRLTSKASGALSCSAQRPKGTVLTVVLAVCWRQLVVFVFIALPDSTDMCSFCAHISREISHFIYGTVTSDQMCDMDHRECFENFMVFKVVIFPMAVHLPIASCMRDEEYGLGA